ncbi:MAG TPA: aminotransferase class I/II-fold pyridoxal phosphate-dependent enzyme [Candidatus Omnitrophica bacterium]|nr:aminotransferase class I/II-fold pyridoxal phosphate-dependent enzyme [Candidatus Omnitrophota bacterium]
MNKMDRFISHKVKNLAPSGIRQFFDLVLKTKDVVSLGVGEPDFPAPWRIREKAIYSLEQGYTSYTSNKGLLRLRLEIAHFLKKHYRLIYDPEQEILVTTGVSEGLDLAIRAVLNPQERVILVYPCYVAYPAVVELSAGRVVPLYTSFEEGFKINPEKLKELIKKYRPKAIILNYPANPTGVSYSKEELKKLWRVLSKEDLLVISDEIYDLITYDFKHTPFSAFKGAKGKTIYLGGFSKNYAMTGFRVGFACGRKELIEQMSKIHSFVMLCAPITSQLSAVEALNSQKDVEYMVKEYRRRRDFIVSELNSLGFKTLLPQGTFYCFSSVKNTGLSSLEFASLLLKKVKVAVVPGEAFGLPYKDFIRISFASPFQDLKEAILRIRKFKEQYLKN